MHILRRLGELTKFALQARGGEIGKIEGVHFDVTQWVVRYFVVHTGGWLSGRKVLIAAQAVTGIDEDRRDLRVDLDRARVEKCPPLDPAGPVLRAYEYDYYRYYGWAPYWTADPLEATIRPEAAGSNPECVPGSGQSHLHGSGEVRGYHIHAQDGEIGHVEDLLIDDQDWRVRYLEVHTRNWWPGRKVLLAPTWIRAVSRPDQKVHVGVQRETIRTAPEYDPSMVVSRDDEIRVFQHYSRANAAGH